MVYYTRQLNRVFRFTRRYCSGACSESLPNMSEVSKAVSPSVVGLLTYFSGGESPGTGVFVDRKLIVTTASTVSRVSTVYDSDSSSVVHDCFISKAIAYTEQGKMLRTNPAAVHVEGDLAVLEVEEAEDDSWPLACAVAETHAKGESQLMALAIRSDFKEFLYLPRVVKTVRPKAPWPLEEELGWVDYGFSNKNVGARGCVSVDKFCGTPWFNIRKEVAGVSTWWAADADGDIKGYVVPPQRIKLMIEYANTKGPHDPIVIDSWIKSYTISEHDSNMELRVHPHCPSTHYSSPVTKQIERISQVRVTNNANQLYSVWSSLLIRLMFLFLVHLFPVVLSHDPVVIHSVASSHAVSTTVNIPGHVYCLHDEWQP